MSISRILMLPCALALTLAAPLALAGGIEAPQVKAEQQHYQLSPEGALRRELARGVYQVVYSPATNSLYVASSEAITNVKGGAIYQLDPATLEITGLFHTDEKNFGLALDPSGETLFVTNSLAAGLSRIDLKSGKVTHRVRFTERSDDGTPYGPRAVIFDDSTNTLFVGGVGDPGRIWAVNPDDLSIRASIPDAGKWVTGLLRDPRDNRLFAANGDGEVLVIDARTYEILQRWKPAGAEKALLLNLALDPEGERLFVTDHSQLKTVLVLDARTGELRQRLPVGESMDINFQPARNALFVTHRDRGLVSELDASTYQVRQQYALPPQPNSLALSPTGDTLFVTIKTPFAPDRSASGVGSIARIELK